MAFAIYEYERDTLDRLGFTNLCPRTPEGRAMISNGDTSSRFGGARRAAMSPTARALLAEVLGSRDALVELAAALAPLLAPRSLDAAPAYTTATLAAKLGRTPKTIRNAIERGELPAVKRGGKWIIHPDAVDAYATPGPPATRAAGGRRPRATSGSESVRDALGEAIGLRGVEQA